MMKHQLNLLFSLRLNLFKLSITSSIYLFLALGTLFNPQLLYAKGSTLNKASSTPTTLTVAHQLQNILNVKVLTCNQEAPCSNTTLIRQIYHKHNNNPLWLKYNHLNDDGDDLIAQIATADLDGLNANDYHLAQIHTLVKKLKTKGYARASLKQQTLLLAKLDLLLTNAFFAYAHDLNLGTMNINKMYPYWQAIKFTPNFEQILNNALADHAIAEAIKNLTPQYVGYTKLKHKLAEYREVELNNGDWEPIPAGDDLEHGDDGSRVKLLQKRLLITGELSKIKRYGEFTNDVKQAVIQYQENNGLYDDGIVDNDTRLALNVPIRTIINHIKLNMDKIRLLPNDLGTEYIMINLPDYTLNLVKDKKTVLTMDVAVGGNEHPSCILNSKINYLVLNPYWYIPTNIASSELLPAIKNDPNYFKEKNVTVFIKTGNVYKEMDDKLVAWKNLTAKDMRNYRFRQAPGKNNALGKVKFIFPNACQIYLHDSNESEVFDVYRRNFSHGCIRLSEPLLLTNYVLAQQKNWSDSYIESIIITGNSRVVNFTTPLNLYIVYFTAWVDNDDWLQLRPDIYNLDH